MDQVIQCDKSYQERLQEYVDVLTAYETEELSEINHLWSLHLEQFVDPLGWQAVWKVPRLTCERLSIPFPALVLLCAKHVDYTKQTAVTKVLTSNVGLDDSREFTVPLVELWPTKQQDKTLMLDLELTAKCIDALRFFYNNLYMPWEDETENTATWLHTVLEPRLLLYYNMKNSIVPPAVAERLKFLYTEAKRLEMKRAQMLVSFGDEANLLDLNSKETEAIMEVQVSLKEVENEVTLLENPKVAQFLIKDVEEFVRRNPKQWVVIPEFTSAECIDLLDRIKSFWPEIVYEFIPFLYALFQVIYENDTVIFSKGKHLLIRSEILEFDLTFKGLYESNETIISAQTENMMFNVNANVTFENLTFDAASTPCGILVSSGKLTLVNCKIIGDELSSSTHQGFIVLGNSTLELINCTVTGFATAIVLNANAKLLLKSSVISNVNLGLKIYGTCAVSIEESEFQNCRDFGVSLEMESEDGEDQYGSIEMLNQ